MKKKFVRFYLWKKPKILLIMKLSAIFMVVFTLNLSATGFGQFSFASEGKKIREIMDIIERESNYRFFYNDEFESVDKVVDLKIKDKDINQVLDHLLASTDYTYKVFANNLVVISLKDEVRELVEGQQNIVKGMVTDEQGNPLPGVTVIVKGTTRGSTSDINGNYSIAIDNPQTVLVFSFVGHISQEETVGNRVQINITLKEDVVALEEVVVVGYGTMRKSDLTGSVVSANIEAFSEIPNVNIMQSLQGVAPGVQIGQVNQAGQEPAIQIRGVNTLSGNDDPLIIVDEIIYSGRMGDLNPADIKSIEVLKDASSKAIYGSQAANGVILITTKSGKKSEKPVFNYSGSISFQSPTIDAGLLNSQQTLEKVKGIYYTKAYLAPDYTEPNPAWTWGQTELVPALLTGIQNSVDYDWWNELTSPGFIEDHMLSLSGGMEKTTYYLSGGYTEENGFIVNDNYKRYTSRINFKNDIKDWLTIGMNTFGSFTDLSGESPSYSTIVTTSPFVTPFDANGNLIVYPKGESTTHLNPLLNVQSDDKQIRNRISGIFYANIIVPKITGLSYRLNYNHSLDWTNSANSSEYKSALAGYAIKTHASQHEETLDNILTYDRQFKDHSVKATLVYGFRKAAYNYTRAQGENITNISLSYNSLQQAITQRISSSGWDESSLYQMARVNYNFRDRYLFTGTWRRDGYSGFAKNNKFAIFPSLAVGWTISNEPFFNLPVVDLLKLRASYGQNGNQTSRYSSIAQVSAIDDFKYVFGDGASTSTGQAITSLANNDLTWEKTAGLNIGLDFGIMKSRIRGNVEFYKTTTTDLLWNMVIPEVTGFSIIKTNIGEVANSGIEFSIQAIPVQTKDFGWDLSVNFSANTNKIVHLFGDDTNNDGKEDDLISSGLFIGKSIGTIYSYQIDGIYQIADTRPTGYYPGNYRIVDQNGDGKISADFDRVFLGRSEPAFMASLQNNLKYKNFTLRFFINSIQGGKDGYLGSQATNALTLNSTGNFANANTWTFYDFWSVTNPDAKYSVNYQAPQILAERYSSRSFIRLQDISLAYQMNPSIIQKIGIEGLKLYVSGKNLLTITDWDGWDPETNQGISSTTPYPVMKSFTLGVDLAF